MKQQQMGYVELTHTLFYFCKIERLSPIDLNLNYTRFSYLENFEIKGKKISYERNNKYSFIIYYEFGS